MFADGDEGHAVAAFLADKLDFQGIADTVEKALDNHKQFTTTIAVTLTNVKDAI